jgi:hypothetical protein
MSGPTSGQAPSCTACGAPEDTTLVTCKFCQHPYNAEVARTAIPCPSCKTLNRYGAQKCVHCQAWVVVSCVFCGSLSPCTMSSCLQCNEAFAGAPQRKAAMDSQRQQQQAISLVGAAAPILGGVLGGIVAAELGSSSSSDDSYDNSSSDVDTYDNSSFDDDSSS